MPTRTTVTPENADRRRAAWLGLAVGNALGGPLEHLWRNQIQIKYGYVRDMIGGGWLDLNPGQTTSDVRVARAMANYLAETGGDAPALDLGRRYATALPASLIDVSPTARTSLALIEDGLEESEIRTRATNDQGDVIDTAEVLARAAVFALYAAPDLDAVAHGCACDATLTHGHAEARDASVACGVWLASALGAASLRDSLEGARQFLDDSTEHVNVLARDDRLPDPETIASDAGAVAVLHLVQAESLASGTFEDVLLRVVNHGGHSDASGAVTGALLGALLGSEAIPRRWLTALDDTTGWERDGRFLWSVEEVSEA